MMLYKQLFHWKRWRYLFRGLVGRMRPKACPSCKCVTSQSIDRKFFYTLDECAHCGLLYRYPADDESQFHEYYQEEYAGAWDLNSFLPGEQEVAEELRRNFQGSHRDVSNIISIASALGVSAGARVLDYGANWGYGCYQFRRAGYEAEAYEISRSRATFGSRIGIQVCSVYSALSGDFDLIFSRHVLEHVPNPEALIREQWARLRPGGYLIAFTPNGAKPYRKAQPSFFHHIWGEVHPVLLTDAYVRYVLADIPLLLASGPLFQSLPLSEINAWDRQSTYTGDLSETELVFIGRKLK